MGGGRAQAPAQCREHQSEGLTLAEVLAYRPPHPYHRIRQERDGGSTGVSGETQV